MASVFPSSSVITLLVALAILALCASPALAASAGLWVKLKSVDFDKNLSIFERVLHGTKRGQHRLQGLNAMSLAATGNYEGIKAPVHAGSGEFLMNLSIGTPPVSYSAILDTGSDLIWTQCKPCQQCFNQPTPIFDPKESSSFSKLPCSNAMCKALPRRACNSNNNACEYLYSYGDTSSSQGILSSETFTFGDVSVPNIGFGCGLANEGDGFTQGAGLVGLGRGPLSLVSQLKEPKFSYCLTSINDPKTSTLLMGSLASSNSSSDSTPIQTTPLIKNPLQTSFYYLSLEGISVGGTRLAIDTSTFELQDDGTGGLIIDSGTTITYLTEDAFDLVKEEFISQTKLSVVDAADQTGLDVCFKLPSGLTNVEVPKLVFHFKGADVDLPADNYMIADSSMGLACLAMGSSSSMSIFGNVQQQNMLVLYDLQTETLSFLPTQCDKL